MTRSFCAGWARGTRAERYRLSARTLARSLAVLAVAFWIGTGTAAAQSAPIGEPQPDPDMEDGRVAVRLIGEDESHPIAGESIVLTASDDSSVRARTGGSGWARFPSLSAGIEYRARAEVDEETYASAPFEAPAEGGLRVTLSLEEPAASPQHERPIDRARGRGGARGGGRGGGGMPDPREMSGVPRPEQADPPGRLTVRAVQGEFSATESAAPEQAEVHLVGYGVDGTVTRESKRVPPDEGRVAFDGLATDRTRSYYAVAVFERGDISDRLLSNPVTLPESTGLRLMLAAPAEDSDEPPVDDVIQQSGAEGPALAPGRVVARLIGEVGNVSEVELIEVGNPDRAQRTPVSRPEPIPSDVQGELAGPDRDDSLADGVVVVSARGQGQALADVPVTLAPADDEGEALEARTKGEGRADFEEARAGARYRVTAAVHGREFTSEPFEVPEEGGVRFRVQASWQPGGMLEGRFDDVPAGPDKVYAAQVRTSEGVYRSMPFQLTDERGAAVGVVVFENALLRFHLGGEVDDELFWFDAQFALRNPTTAPLRPDEGQLSIPIPKDFKHASVREEDEGKVRTDSEGYIWRGPVAPGRDTFRGQFALPIEGGTFEFDMPLPHGAWNSQIILQKLPGMELNLPDVSGMQEETRSLEGREFTLLSGINIEHGKRLVIGGEGLPQRPASERYMRWGAGLLGLAFLVWGFVGLFRRRAGAEEEDRKTTLQKQRERLLDELAELERQYKHGEVTESRYRRSRENLRIELENVYTELGVGGSEQAS